MNRLGKSAAIFGFNRTCEVKPTWITIPDHDSLRIGTLNGILSDVADYLGMERTELAQQLFTR